MENPLASTLCIHSFSAYYIVQYSTSTNINPTPTGKMNWYMNDNNYSTWNLLWLCKSKQNCPLNISVPPKQIIMKCAGFLENGIRTEPISGAQRRVLESNFNYFENCTKLHLFFTWKLVKWSFYLIPLCNNILIYCSIAIFLLQYNIYCGFCCIATHDRALTFRQLLNSKTNRKIIINGLVVTSSCMNSTKFSISPHLITVT